jgi:molybdopterin-containing oxidoreductase family iron-sulfur binding subunit
VGHAEAALTVTLGWGQKTGHDWADVGANAYPLRTRGEPFIVRGAQLAKTGRTHTLAVTQPFKTAEGRKIALVATAEALAKGDNPAAGLHEPVESFHNRLPTAAMQWGMSIDQSACIGCGACMVACQAENNVPVVGYQGVLKNRQMHWLRIDHYDVAATGRTVPLAQPMLCQHCEKAPCEYVCPVHATVHSDDGLNEMVYNRCVGTRFCSNNCPYKVRRFNWFNYHRDDSQTVQMQHNPDVTVRARGVMEKCTYCVQRIRGAGIHARVTNKPIPRDEPQTACAQACPTRAIVFGNIRDPEAKVTGLRELPRSYGVLQETGTEPRTRYLVKVLNPNPEIDHA